MSTDKEATLSTGRRIWLSVAMIVSGLVLLIAASGIIGTWAARGIVIDMGTSALETIERVSGLGREGVATVAEVVTIARGLTGEVEAAVDQIAQNVSDRGVILTLLPPEKEQALIDAVDKIRSAVASIQSVIAATVDLIDAINSIPFVSLPGPEPEKVQAMEAEVQALREGVEQLTSNIQQFRDNTAGDIGQISDAAGTVSTRLDTTSANLGEIDGTLAAVEIRASALRESLATYVTIAAVLLTLFFAWVIYGMFALVQGYWRALSAPGAAPVALDTAAGGSESEESLTAMGSDVATGASQDADAAEETAAEVSTGEVDTTMAKDPAVDNSLEDVPENV